MEQKTSDLDVVYFVKESNQISSELNYSLRSVVKNLPCRKVWIYGGCPPNVKPGKFVKIQQVGATKWDKVRAMYRQVCLNQEISEDFILMNDDFYIIKKIDTLPAFYRCGLAEHILQIENKFGDRINEYSKLLRTAYKTLTCLGLPTNSYELHIPMVFNRHKLLEVLGAFPDGHCMRTIYGNYFKLGGTQRDDVKIFNANVPIEASDFLSSDDPYFGPESTIRKKLEKLFPDKCKYEA